MFFGASSTAIDLVAVIAQPLEALYQVRPGGDDRAAALLFHDRRDGKRRIIDRLHVDRGDQVERVFLHGEHVAVAVGVAGIVDHHVDAAEGVHCRPDHLVDLGALRHVDAHGDRRLADGVGYALRALDVQVGDHDLGALLGETFRDALAEARRRAGDDRDLVFETCHDALFPGLLVPDYWWLNTTVLVALMS
jgi:hypothetical protein